MTQTVTDWLIYWTGFGVLSIAFIVFSVIASIILLSLLGDAMKTGSFLIAKRFPHLFTLTNHATKFHGDYKGFLLLAIGDINIVILNKRGDNTNDN